MGIEVVSKAIPDSPSIPRTLGIRGLQQARHESKLAAVLRVVVAPLFRPTRVNLLNVYTCNVITVANARP